MCSLQTPAIACAVERDDFVTFLCHAQASRRRQALSQVKMRDAMNSE